MNDDWIARWNEGATGWRYPEADQELESDFQRLRQTFQLPGGAEAFVPLCGDSWAVRYLYDQSLSVTGLDVAPRALELLRTCRFPEVQFERRREGACEVYSAPRVRLIEGDIFALETACPFHFIYDRAALVALPPSIRQQYASLLVAQLARNGVLYLVSYEYEATEQTSAPYSVPRLESLRLFAQLEEVDYRAEQLPVIPESMRMQAKTPPLRSVSIFCKRA
ncbi:MAG: hypothetical protein KDD69_10205 [Bdellovibrionales bacterium]|nr:hypothetical protein [Bdellovibrionales bacterium]